jgi:hypothetical protein
MFKFNHHVFNQTMSNIKKGIHHGYHQVKHISNYIHHGVNTAAQIYNAVAPAIKHFAPHHSKEIHHTVNNLASNYSQLRSKVIEADHHISHAGSKINGLI